MMTEEGEKTKPLLQIEDTMKISISISHLPTDLVEEILCRIPLKYMRAVRLTCKKWDTLSKSRSFLKTHAAKEKEKEKEGESRMIVLRDSNLYLTSIVVNGNPSVEPKGKLSCLNDSDQQLKIFEVYHCDGLLLCILKDDNTRLMVWNPYSGQTRWIKFRYSLPGIDMYTYALGYEINKKKKSHQILRFVNCALDEVLWYEIYDFDSDLWTTLDVPPTPNLRIIYYNLGISIKGNTYWCAYVSNQPNLAVDLIICFDFTRKRFGPLLHLPFRAVDGNVELSCVREEKLAALYYYELGIDIWITTEIEPTNISWRKFLTLKLGPYSPIQNASFFIDEVKKVAMLFDKSLNRYIINVIGEAGYVRQVDLVESLYETATVPGVCSYAPSLVQIKQAAGGKRRKQSSLEKCRCDQNVLRFEQYVEACKRRKQDDLCLDLCL